MTYIAFVFAIIGGILGGIVLLVTLCIVCYCCHTNSECEYIGDKICDIPSNFHCCEIYICELGNNHRKYIEVVGFSTLQFEWCNFCCGNVLCWLIFFGLSAIFIIFPISFGGAASDHQQMTDSLQSGDDGVLYYLNEWGEPVVLKHPDYPVFFFLMNDYDEGGNSYLQFLVTTSSIWGILDLVATAIVIYRKMRDKKLNKELCCACCNGKVSLCCNCGDLECRPFMLMLSMVAVRLVITLCELIGLFSSLTYFLTAWPTGSILRILNGIHSLIWRTNLECMASCYSVTPTNEDRSKWPFHYTRCAWVLDMCGQGVGFNMQSDPLWEKILTLALEIFDAIFSFIYTLNDYNVSLPLSLLNVICFIKVVSLGVNITLSMKSFIWVWKYTFSLITGAVMGTVTFICFFLMLLRSMRVYNSGTHMGLMVPVIVLVSLFAVAALLCGRTRLTPDESIFHREDETDFWNGECCHEFGETDKHMEARKAAVLPQRVVDVIVRVPSQQTTAQRAVLNHTPPRANNPVVPPPRPTDQGEASFGTRPSSS